MIEIIDTSTLDSEAIDRLLERPALDRDRSIRASVEKIIDRVKRDGDRALIELTRELDQVALDSLEVTAQERGRATDSMSGGLLTSMKRTIETLGAFHRETLPRELQIETAPGVVCGRIVRPIERVGFYIPAGTAPLPSTVLMLGVPAMIAGCDEIVLCSPPNREGKVDPAVLAAAELTGVTRIFPLGGAQAIAAMAYGTESVPAVDKIFGPGNAWVTDAKLVVSSDPRGAAIDMPAGPSEVLVIADDSADPEWVAADLLSQAEHGPTSQAILITTSASLAERARDAISRQLESLPRADVASKAIEGSRLLVVESATRAYELSNRYAPEHLILNVEEPDLEAVRSAGSVFLGRYSPESMGDYCSGTNHVLPTYGWARAYSGVSVMSFVKTISWQKLTAEGLEELGPHAERLAEAEGLEAHRRAIAIRRAG